MIMVNQGIEVIFHLAAPESLGVWSDPANMGYDIKNVRFVAHEVQLDNTFYDRLRASIAASNGVLSMAGTTWRHYLNIIAAGSNKVDVTIATRVKSLKALISRAQAAALSNKSTQFSIGVGQNPFCNDVIAATGEPENGMGATGGYQYRIGSVLYPATEVQVSEKILGRSLRRCANFSALWETTHTAHLSIRSPVYVPRMKHIRFLRQR
jgi:hypothetical protein